jgi:hypothetical protein
MSNIVPVSETRCPVMAQHRNLFIAGRVDAWTTLPDADTLATMRHEADASVRGMGEDAAKDMARMLFGQYTRAKVDDPEIYLRGILSLLVDVPRDIGAAAVDRVTRTRKFLPNRAEVAEVVDGMMAERRNQRALVISMQREADRRQAQADEDAAISEAKAQHLAENEGRSPQELVREAARRLAGE